MKKGIVIGGVVLASAMITWLGLYGHHGKSVAAVDTPASSSSVESLTAPGSTPKLLPQIEKITDAGLHWEIRVQAVRDLPQHLGAASTEQLFAFLRQPPAHGEEDWYLVANEIMEVLRKRNMIPGIYTDRHLQLITDRAADPMIRDYSAQHLAQWISGMDATACETDASKAADAFHQLCQVAADPANKNLTLAGTTLSALADAVTHGRESFQQKQDQVATLALSMLSDPAVSNVNRSTALQVAARLQAEGLADICRSLASSADTPLDVRLSSIAALGLVGTSADLPFLRQYTSDEALKYAASAAANRLSKSN